MDQELLDKVKDLNNTYKRASEISDILNIPCKEILKAFKILKITNKRAYITKDLKFKIQEMHENKAHPKDIAQACDIDIVTVYNNIIIEEKPLIRQEIIDYLKIPENQTKRTKKIAKELSVDPSTIQRAFKLLNIPYNKVQYDVVDNKLLENIRSLRKDKKTRDEICEILNISGSAINKAFRILGFYKPIKNKESVNFNIEKLIYQELSFQQTADRLKITKEEVISHFNTLNLTISHEYDITKDHVNHIINSYAIDSLFNIAKHLNISLHLTKLIYKDLGITDKNSIFNTHKFCTNCNINKIISDFNLPCIKCIDCQEKFENELYQENLEYEAYAKDRRDQFRIVKNVSSAILRSIGSKFSFAGIKPTFDKLPYSAEQLKSHIENLFSHPDNSTKDNKVWMNWDNHGIYDKNIWNDNDPSTWKWQLDHEKPNSLFNYTSFEDDDFKLCWSLKNLRPYSAKQNVIDGSTRIRHNIL